MLPGRKYTPEDILSLLWKRRWFVIIPFIACAMTALLVSRALPNRYQSDTLIQVIPQRVPEAYVKSTVTTKLEDRIQSLTQQIMSRSRLERVIEEFNLYPEARQKGIMQDVVEGMQKDIAVKTTGGRDGVDAFTDPLCVQRSTHRPAGDGAPGQPVHRGEPPRSRDSSPMRRTTSSAPSCSKRGPGSNSRKRN